MDKKTVVLTGGSAGIGLAIVQLLLQQDYRVINLARRPVPFENPDVENIIIDLLDRETLAVVCKQLAPTNATAFVHNAGIIRADLVDDVKLDDLDDLNQLHLGAALQITQALIPNMKQLKSGRIVLISSRASVGMKTRTSYSATKAAQIALARTWALELGEFGVTVNTVAPGPIEATEMFHEVVPERSAMTTKLAAQIPRGRLGLPAAVARATLFFSDPQNGVVTGQNLFVCGGTSIGSI